MCELLTRGGVLWGAAEAAACKIKGHKDAKQAMKRIYPKLKISREISLRNN